MQNLHWLDILIILAYLAFTLIISLYFSKQARKGTQQFFTGGKNLGWFMTGISLVATTFAADTPLAVADLVAKNGISGNWVWWCFCIGGMFTAFFFSKLWRRSEVLTEPALVSLRYDGKGAQFLRSFKAIYFGFFINLLILCWVNLAMIDIVAVFFEIPKMEAIIWVGAILLFTGFYTSLSGLKGVVFTDVFQFFLAMGGCIYLAYAVVVSPEIGGIEGLKAKVPAESLQFLPTFSGNQGTFALSIPAFIAMGFFIWWTSWYPGNEPGGGGYVVQRILSTRNESQAFWSTVFFQFANYGIRPWPWIITGLCCMVLYPNAGQKGYIYAMRDYLDIGTKGLLITAFLGAYMSTMATQLNWGASYLVNDLLKFRWKKPESFSTFSAEADANVNPQAEKYYVRWGGAFTILLGILSLLLTLAFNNIAAIWEIVVECGAGLGFVLIGRWLWWRFNAWSEIAASIGSILGYLICKYILVHFNPDFARGVFDYPLTFYTTVLFTIAITLFVTFITPATQTPQLQAFYNRVRPYGRWGRFTQHQSENQDWGWRVLATLLAVILTYAFLFLTGALILELYQWVWGCLITLFLSISGLIWLTKRYQLL